VRVLLPRIPATVTKNQLRQFAARVLDSKFSLPFTAKPSLGDCEILQITDQHAIAEHHGLISISPESAAHWFIKNVRGKMLANKRILAREYLDRKGNKDDFSAENDRRNPLASVEKIDEQRVEVEGLEQFRRTND